MVARSAADDVDVVDGVDVIVVEREAVEEHVAVLDGTADSVAHGTRLFEDFLEHEIGEAAALGVFGIPIDMRGLELDRMTGRAKVLDARGPEQRELTVFEKDDVAREIHYGDDVARHEGGRLVPFGKPDDDRAVLARHRYLARVVDVHDGKAVRTLQVIGRAREGFDQVALVVLLDEVRDDFGIRLAPEHVPFRFEQAS